MMPPMERRTGPPIQRFLWRHWKGAVVSLFMMLGTLTVSLGFGIITPQAQFARVDSQVDTLRHDMRTVRNEFESHQIREAATQDSILRLIRILVVFQCYQLQELQVIASSLPCPDVPTGYPRRRR